MRRDSFTCPSDPLLSKNSVRNRIISRIHTTQATTLILIGKKELQTEFSLGAHLTTPRKTCVHHGIYVGNGRVIHNKWFLLRFWNGGVREVSLTEFSLGRLVTHQKQTIAIFPSEEIVARAYSRMGERRYKLLTNNCEHFTRWCLTGISRSFQIEIWQARYLFLGFLLFRSISLLGDHKCSG